MIDRFGKDVAMVRLDESRFMVNVTVAVSRQFLAWIIGLGEGVRIAGPDSVLDMMQEEIDYVCRHGIYTDYKTRLQEYLQQHGDVDISYQLLGSSGPEHNKIFTSEVLLEGRVIGEGQGRTKTDS